MRFCERQRCGSNPVQLRFSERDTQWRKYAIDDIKKRDKKSLDIFWIKDKSLADLDNLPSPDELAADIIENLQSALDSFKELQAQLRTE